MAWHSLTHEMHENWKTLGLKNQRLLVLCSGGADSVALSHLASELSRPLGYELTLGHFHHGPGSTEAEVYRDSAQNFCQKWAAELKLPFLIAQSSDVLKSEEEMRELRRSQALLWQKQNSFDRILLAHHAEDLLETRFFRLLRGTSERGVEAMKVWEKPWWRPFLKVGRGDLRNYLQWNHLSFCSDPSNEENVYRRNWLRNEVFPSLEKQMPGSLKNMQKFFDQMTSDFEEIQLEDKVLFGQIALEGFSASWFLTLSMAQKRRTLAQYLWSLGVRNFRQTQLNEVMKHLDIPQNVHTFCAAGCEWQLNAGQIFARPQESRTRDF